MKVMRMTGIWIYFDHRVNKYVDGQAVRKKKKRGIKDNFKDERGQRRQMELT